MKRSGKFFVVYTNTLESGKTPRIDIVVGTSVSKKAVLRNKTKRQIREILRSFDIISKNKVNLKIVALPNSLGVAFGEFKIDLEKVLGGL